MTEEMSFQVSLENGQGFSNLDEGGKFIAVVQSRNHKGLDKKLCSVLCKEGPDLSDVV